MSYRILYLTIVTIMTLTHKKIIMTLTDVGKSRKSQLQEDELLLYICWRAMQERKYTVTN